jgi:hypothetical protein
MGIFPLLGLALLGLREVGAMYILSMHLGDEERRGVYIVVGE